MVDRIYSTRLGLIEDALSQLPFALQGLRSHRFATVCEPPHLLLLDLPILIYILLSRIKKTPPLIDAFHLPITINVSEGLDINVPHDRHGEMLLGICRLVPIVDKRNLVLGGIARQGDAYLFGGVDVLGEEVPHFGLFGVVETLLLEDQLSVVSH